MHCTRIGVEKRMAAKLDGPAGLREHQCNNIKVRFGAVRVVSKPDGSANLPYLRDG